VWGIVFQAWVKNVCSQSFSKNVKNKVTFDGTRSNGTVIARVFSFAINLNLFRDGTNNTDGVVVVGEWIARVIVFVGGVHHNTSVTVVEDFAVFVHVVLSFSTSSSVVFLEVTPTSIVPDWFKGGEDRVVNVDHVSLVDLGVVTEDGQHRVHLRNSGESHWDGGGCECEY
jgi:hypothetical protein